VIKVIDESGLSSRPYRRPFARPLKAAWGEWSIREGLLLRLEDPDSGRVAFGEVAPLPTKGGKHIPPLQSSPSLESFSSNPSSAFALWSAQTALESTEPAPPPVRTAALLSLDSESPASIARLRESGARTFKLKLGLDAPDTEWNFLQAVAISLKPGDKLRLDPNRSWDEPTWKFWKPRLNGLSEWIQFLEEPFNKDMGPEGMLREANASPIALALDESLSDNAIAEWADLHWPGYWIIKPSVLGPPDYWLPPIAPYKDKIVLSSCFETGIGMSALIRMAGQFPGIDHGLGTQAYFDDAFGVSQTGSILTALTLLQQEDLWKSLPED
jgi:O-succinylbenzoate synthase